MAKRPTEQKPQALPRRRNPWDSVEFTYVEAMAVKAVAEGRATPRQQEDAIAFICQKLCRMNRPSFCAADPRGTDVAEGRRLVGIQIMRLIRSAPGALKQEIIEENTNG